VSEPTIDRSRVPAIRAGSWLDATRAVRERIARAWPRIVIVSAVTLVFAGQVLEDLADSPPLQLLTPETAVRRWTIIFAAFYMLATANFVDGLVDRSLVALDGVFELAPDRFAAYARAIRHPGVRIEGVLFVASAGIVAILFVVLGVSLPIDDPVTGAPRLLPSAGPTAFLILLEYAVVGWAISSLVFASIRRARALGRLAREPIDIDVFDTTKLLPLGNIALASALAPAGIIVILLVGYGRPSQPLSWSVLLLATIASILALILPLRGIHRQMARARYAALARLNGQLRRWYDVINAGGEIDMAESARRNNHVAAVTALRTTVGQMTTWPFRDTLAFGRAVLIASAPLIYTIISELIKVIWINPLGHP